MKAVCPNGCPKKEFITSVIEHHDWKVDEEGNFIEDKGCTQSGKPQSDVWWTCAECGAVARVS
jgi:hypothetical protein